MDRQTFTRRFREAATAARDFAKTLVDEVFPDAMVFRVHFNSSGYGNPLPPDERVYPEDGSSERACLLPECTEDMVISTLWRDGSVPYWVDVSVVSETGEETLIGLLACGEFTANDESLYHERGGRPPFHVLGPTLPFDFQDGQRFSIHYYSECLSVSEFQRLQRHNSKVWALELIGQEFDDQALATLPELPGMEILELTDSPVKGLGLRILDRYPKLRVLRVALRGDQDFSINHLPVLQSLETLDLYGVPSVDWGFEDLASKTTALSSMTLRSSGDLVVHGKSPVALSDLSLTATRLGGNLALPKQLDTVGLHLSQASSEEIERIFAPVENIRCLALDSTKVEEALALRLAKRLGLKRLILLNTGLDREAVQRIASANPELYIKPGGRAASQ